MKGYVMRTMYDVITAVPAPGSPTRALSLSLAGGGSGKVWWCNLEQQTVFLQLSIISHLCVNNIDNPTTTTSHRSADGQYLNNDPLTHLCSDK